MNLLSRFKSLIDKPTSLIHNSILTLLILSLATFASFVLFHLVPENTANVALVYITAVVMIARFTTGYFFGILASLVSVVGINFLFTYPYFEVNFTLTGYPVTFLFTLIISITVSAITTRLKEQTDKLVEREKLLMEAEKEKMRANLLRSVSHDLRTPLTGIIGNSSTYIDNYNTLDDDERLQIVSHIKDDSNWLLNMVENLLSVTRIHQQSMKIATSEESVEEVVAEAMQRLQKRLPNAKINVSVPDEFIMLPMDAMLIEQVIINLLENAIIHSQSQEPVEFTVTSNKHHVSFCIKDYGIGLPPDKLGTIFDGSCYTPENTSDGHKGMGIGLSICKTIIVAHSGTIHAANHKKGCEFIFTLPRRLQNE